MCSVDIVNIVHMIINDLNYFTCRICTSGLTSAILYLLFSFTMDNIMHIVAEFPTNVNILIASNRRTLSCSQAEQLGVLPAYCRSLRCSTSAYVGLYLILTVHSFWLLHVYFVWVFVVKCFHKQPVSQWIGTESWLNLFFLDIAWMFLLIRWLLSEYS